jgi:hypothetical protein
MQTAQNDLMIPAHRLRLFIKQHLQGQCKILSEGNVCQCALCDLDRIIEPLRWYEDEARALSINMEANKDMAVLASVRVLSLDAGKRSTAVLGQL